jgi:hypothetical protein
VNVLEIFIQVINIARGHAPVNASVQRTCLIIFKINAMAFFKKVKKFLDICALNIIPFKNAQMIGGAHDFEKLLGHAFKG